MTLEEQRIKAALRTGVQLIGEIEQLRQSVAELEEERNYWESMVRSDDGYTREIEEQLAASQKRVAELEAEVVLLCGQLNSQQDSVSIPRYNNDMQEMEDKLAAAQLQNSQLREALENLLFVTKHLHPCEGTVAECKEALSQPTDTAALESYVKERLGEPVAYVQATPDGNLMLAEIVKTKECVQLDQWDRQMGWTAVPLYALKEPK